MTRADLAMFPQLHRVTKTRVMAWTAMGATYASSRLTHLGVLSCVAMVALAVAAPPLQDYPAYIEHWRAIVGGTSPWSMHSNSYGPLYVALAPLVWIDDRAPRVLGGLLFAATCMFLWWRAYGTEWITERRRWILAACLFANPLIYVFAAACGSNDALMATCVVGSLALYGTKRDWLSGTLMGAAICVKLIPVFLLPFLVVSRGRIRWRFAIAVTLTVALAFGACYLAWGAEIFHPFQKAAERPSKGVSIFKFLRSDFSPLHWLTSEPNVDWLSSISAAVALTVLFAAHLKRGFAPVTSAMIGLAILLTLFKVGHYQFYLTLIVVAVWWLVSTKPVALRTRAERRLFVFIAWLAALSISYVAFHGHFGHGTEWVRELLAIPHLAISVWLVWSLIRYADAEARAA